MSRHSPHEQEPIYIGPKTMFKMDGKTICALVLAVAGLTAGYLRVNAQLTEHEKTLAAHTVTLGQIQELQKRDDAKLNALLNNKAGLSRTTESVANAP